MEPGLPILNLEKGSAKPEGGLSLVGLPAPEFRKANFAFLVLSAAEEEEVFEAKLSVDFARLSVDRHKPVASPRLLVDLVMVVPLVESDRGWLGGGDVRTLEHGVLVGLLASVFTGGHVSEDFSDSCLPPHVGVFTGDLKDERVGYVDFGEETFGEGLDVGPCGGLLVVSGVLALEAGVDAGVPEDGFATELEELMDLDEEAVLDVLGADLVTVLSSAPLRAPVFGTSLLEFF